MHGYTSGPWGAVQQNFNINLCRPIEIQMPNNSSCFVTGDAAEANARLIAAGPELLEALEIAMEWINGWDVAFKDGAEWADDNNKIKAAIAKARGK